MLLAKVQDILDDLGYESKLVNMTNAVTRSLHFATALLAAELTTDFTLGTVVDTFYVPEPSRMLHGNAVSTFRLSQGFLSGGILPQAFLADRSDDFYGAPTPSMGSLFQVSMEKGVMTDITTKYYRQWLRIRYAKGFPVDPQDATSYDLAWVPEWLSEAAKLNAKISLQSNPSLEDPGVKLDTKMLREMFSSLVKPHLRYAPQAYQPTSTYIAVRSLPGDPVSATDPTLADQVTLRAGAAITGHRVLTYDMDWNVVPADPFSSSYSFAGISVAAALPGGPVNVVDRGRMQDPAWAWNPGDRLFVGPGGELTSAPPTSGVSQQVATAVLPDTISVQPYDAVTLT